MVALRPTIAASCFDFGICGCAAMAVRAMGWGAVDDAAFADSVGHIILNPRVGLIRLFGK